MRRLVRTVPAERRLSAWLQGWTLFVIAGFVTKLFVAEMPWWLVAAIAGFHTTLYSLLICHNAHRWRLEYRRQALEAKYSGGP